MSIKDVSSGSEHLLFVVTASYYTKIMFYFSSLNLFIKLSVQTYV